MTINYFASDDLGYSELMPSKHRPTRPIPKSLEFLARTRWLPFLLLWVAILGVTYAIWWFR